jgi:hypothetical protein
LPFVAGTKLLPGSGAYGEVRPERSFPETQHPAIVPDYLLPQLVSGSTQFTTALLTDYSHDFVIRYSPVFL